MASDPDSDSTSWPTLPSGEDGEPGPLSPKVDGGVSGIITPLFQLGWNTIGALMVAAFIGIASIPLGVGMAIADVLGGVTSFAISFIQALFLPLISAAGVDIGSVDPRGVNLSSWLSTQSDLVQRLGDDIVLKGVGNAETFVEGLGLPGFLISLILAGLMMYGMAEVTSRYV